MEKYKLSDIPFEWITEGLIAEMILFVSPQKLLTYNPSLGDDILINDNLRQKGEMLLIDINAIPRDFDEKAFLLEWEKWRGLSYISFK